jgi:hypothetical protein
MLLPSAGYSSVTLKDVTCLVQNVVKATFFVIFSPLLGMFLKAKVKARCEGFTCQPGFFISSC